MDALSIILLAVAVLLGAAVIYLVIRRKPIDNGSSDLLKENEAYQGRISELESNIDELRRTVDEKKSKIDSLVSELEDVQEKNKVALRDAKEKISKLEESEKTFLSGNIDEAVKLKLDELDKIKKKVKSLESELEDAEDDLASTEKKLKSTKAEKEEIETRLNDAIRKYTQLEGHIDTMAQEIQEKKKEIAAQNDSLAFVQEVLSAPSASDESVSRLYRAIDSMVDFVSNEAKDCITRIVTNMPEDYKRTMFGSELEGWAISMKKNWIHGKTSIAFVGEFSAGKTSIVNRILSQDNPNIPLLPVSTKATTAIPTYISGGVSTRYQFVTPDNILKTISEETFKKVSKEVLDRIKGVSNLIQYFVMTYNNPNLNNLSILDTPGFNSNDAEDAERTIGVINECDALFWVFDVNAGTVNRSSINIIKEHLNKPLYIVINQIDTKSKSEVDSVENLIRRTLSDAGLKVEGFIRFSRKEPLDVIMRPIKSIVHDTKKESYLNELWQMIMKVYNKVSQNVNAANARLKNARNSQQRLLDKFVNGLRRMQTDCETVYNIPQLNERWFHEDDFRISKADYSKFTTLLEIIHGQLIQDIANAFDQHTEAVSELEEAHSEHERSIHQKGEMEECMKSLRKKAKELNITL